MARSLARNTRMFASTLTRAELQVLANNTTSKTFEIKVLDGYSFSQDTSTQEIGISESDSETACQTAGTGLSRGTLSFNTALNPVDVSFSTYVRAYIDGNTKGNCVERVLWASAMGTAKGFSDSPAAAGTGTYNQTATDIIFGVSMSNANELLPLTLLFVLQNTTYVIENFNVGTAEVDFSIDGIATINWSGNGSFVNEDPIIHEIFKINGGTAAPGTTNVTTAGLYLQVPTTQEFLRNKLSTLELRDVTTPSVPVALDAEAGSYDVNTGVFSFVDVTELNGKTDGEVVGGRLYNQTLNQWATIVARTDATVTIAAADRGLVDGWNYVAPGPADLVDVYGPKQFSGVEYCIPITGATLTLENNLTYLTPEELAIVNIPLAGFAGNRVTSGSFTAYLNTGAMGTGGLLADLLAKIETSVTTNYELIFHMGNNTGETPRVDFLIPHAQISIPSTNVEDIISTEISFVAKPWNTAINEASFEDVNEITITYAN